MLASELIKQLQAAINEFGDKPVKYNDGHGDFPVVQAVAYDKNGNPATSKDECIEIYLH